jgi:muramoyltetrapeptide carboxypeptidase
MDAGLIIKPRQLKSGDTLALVAPASPKNEDEQVRMAVETILSLGFKVMEGAHLYTRNGYLAGADLQRASDLNEAFADEEVDGIIALCGGYGSPRILPYLDYEMIHANPKALIGYSDITALLNGIHHKTGLVTFHGPIASQVFTPYVLREFKKVLLAAESNVLLGHPDPVEQREGVVERSNRITRIAGGKAQGRLVGGNLSLMATLCGTPYMPDLAGKILVLEDVGEATYRLDRMLTQLWLSGGLEKCAGIAFGKFSGCSTSASWAKQQTVEEVLVDRCNDMGIPVLRGLMIGHVDDQTTLPVGCLVELDADAGTLRLLEPAVQT